MLVFYIVFFYYFYLTIRRPKVVVEMEREKNSETKTSKTPKISKPAQKMTDKTGDTRSKSGPKVIKCFMLNSTEHEISAAHKN